MDQTLIRPIRGYLVCCIERTGSNVLVSALMRTCLAGRPREYFNNVEQDKPWMRAILGEADYISGLANILAAGSTPNGIFGVKIHLGHFRRLGAAARGEEYNIPRAEARQRLVRARLAAPPSPDDMLQIMWSHFADVPWLSAAYEVLRSALPDLQFIWLTRKNEVARAISHVRARRSGKWWRSALSTEPTADAEWDFDLAETYICHCLGLFEDSLWQRFFEDNGLAPYRLYYEDLVARYEPTVQAVYDFLGIDLGQQPIPAPDSAIQADAFSLVWEERYRAWCAEAGFALPMPELAGASVLTPTPR